MTEFINKAVHTLFRKTTSHPLVEIFRYAIVSILSFGVDFSLLFLLSEIAGFHYQIAAVISYSAGLFVNYLLSIKWAFGRRSGMDSRAEFGIFLLIGLIGMGVNAAILWLAVEVFGLYLILGRVVSAVIGYIWKYIARKIILFR